MESNARPRALSDRAVHCANVISNIGKKSPFWQPESNLWRRTCWSSRKHPTPKCPKWTEVSLHQGSCEIDRNIHVVSSVKKSMPNQQESLQSSIKPHILSLANKWMTHNQIILVLFKKPFWLMPWKNKTMTHWQLHTFYLNGQFWLPLELYYDSGRYRLLIHFTRFQIFLSSAR